MVYRAETNDGSVFAVRRWPDRTDAARVAALHRICGQLIECGFDQLASVFRTRSSSSTVVLERLSPDCRVWHVESWKPGVVVETRELGVEHAEAVGRLLGQLHFRLKLIAERHELFASRIAQPPALVEREHHAARYQAAIASNTTTGFDESTTRALDVARRFLPVVDLALLRQLNQPAVPLQICLRDLKEDSVLWEGRIVSGLIDLSAARADHPCFDIARLFGGLFRNDRRLWHSALTSYEQVVPLTPADHSLIRLAVASELVLSSIGWIERLYWTPRTQAIGELERSRSERVFERLVDESDGLFEDIR